VLDYHLHLWPHSESSVSFHLDQIADYCERAQRAGVTEIALTEHSHRFVDVAALVGPFWLRFGSEPTSAAMAEYWAFHARNSLEEYVTLAQRAQDEGLPVKIGLEVDYYEGRMDVVSELFAQYPFDVLIGSVHWLDTWHLDDYESEIDLAQWHVRDVDQSWRDYSIAIDELCSSNAVDVLAHPDLIKVAGFYASNPGEFWDAMTESAVRVDVSMECSSAGWNKPVAEQYPAEGFLDRLVQRGVTFTTASDAHHNVRVADRVEDLATMLEARGVNELASYTKRQREMIPLRAQ
jgi:histidinol-phosphatase (PHP family)